MDSAGTEWVCLIVAGVAVASQGAEWCGGCCHSMRSDVCIYIYIYILVYAACTATLDYVLLE